MGKQLLRSGTSILRRAREIVPGVVAFFTAIAVTLALFYGAFLAFRSAKAWIEQHIAERLAVTLQAKGEPEPPETPSLVERVIDFFVPSTEPMPAPASNDARDLLFATFTDIFSGIGWIDSEKTTMAQDRMVTAFTFPPKFSWEKVSNSEVSDILKMSDIQKLTGSQRCIASRCLETRDNKLFLNGNEIALPAELGNGSEITSLSAGALETKWLVGAVVKIAQQYESKVFQFDGSTFAPAFQSGAPTLVSKYDGVLGFGGDDGDWVVIYGGYEGFAYRVADGAVLENLSNFFGVRVMDGGFRPTIVRFPLPTTHYQLPTTNYSVTWYVWSETVGKPKLLKLFENGTGRVAGAMDFTEALFGDGGKLPAQAGIAVLFAPPTSGSATLVVAVNQSGGTQKYFTFTDLGFEKGSGYEVVSTNLNSFPGEVKKATVSELALAPEGADVHFYLSNDGMVWEETTLGSELIFANGGGRRLYWKAVFAPKGGVETSPFLDRIRIDYKVKVLQ